MDKQNFEDRATSLVATAAKFALHKGLTIESEILSKAKSSLVKTGYDNWNGGTDLYSLILEVPVTVFADIDEKQATIEGNILERMNQLTRKDFNNRISEVIISPILLENSNTNLKSNSDEETIPTFWQPGYFRLFISHLAKDKKAAHALKEELAKYQIAAFVAHDDIEPTREWQGEIESALRTMDALVALISGDFINSRWCDQEVGIAIGKAKLVIPLRYGADPHGFMGKYQGIQTVGKGITVESISEKIFGVLIKNELSAQRMTDALVNRLTRSVSWDSAKHNMSLLEKSSKINDSHIAELLQAIDANVDVGQAFGVPERIKKLIENKHV